MNTLTIHRWHNSYRSPHRLASELLQQWEDGLHHLDLTQEIDTLIGPEELVFIRQLTLRTRLGEDQSPAQAAALWRMALLRELCSSLEDETRDEARTEVNIVRYRSRRDAIADMLYRSCCGDLSRRWAWRQMGLLPGTEQQAACIDHALSALLLEPTSIWPVLTRLIVADARCGAFVQLLLHTSPGQMRALLAACPQTQVWHRLLTANLPASPVAPKAGNALLAILLSSLKSRRQLMDKHRDTLLVMIAACSQTLADSVPATTDLLDLAAAALWLDQALDAPATLRREPQPSLDKATRGTLPLDQEAPPSSAEHLPPAEPAPDEPSPDDLPLPPPLPTAIDRVATAWGGLLFVLTLVPPSGCLQQLHLLSERSEQTADALPMLLWHMATTVFGIPGSDPAVRAFCGGWQPHADQFDETGTLALSPDLSTLSRQTALTIGELLHRRVPDTELDLTAVCQRPGMLQIEPGWIELHLPLQYADTRLRRAALDLDPGWLPWLACVVRFVYE